MYVNQSGQKVKVPGKENFAPQRPVVRASPPPDNKDGDKKKGSSMRTVLLLVALVLLGYVLWRMSRKEKEGEVSSSDSSDSIMKFASANAFGFSFY